MEPISNFKGSVLRQFKRDIANNDYERTDEGDIYLPSHKLTIGGYFSHSLNGGEVIHEKNLVVNQGLNHILNTVFNGGTQVATWYVGVYGNNITVAATDIYDTAFIVTKAGEISAYDESTRVEYSEATSSAQSMTNSASKATFTFNAGDDVYGAFLVSRPTKLDVNAAGVLMAAANFAAARTVVATDVLDVAYTINASSS